MDNTTDPLEDSFVWLLPILQFDPTEKKIGSRRVLIEGLVLEKVIQSDESEIDSCKRNGLFHAWGSRYQRLLLKESRTMSQGSERMDENITAKERSENIHSRSVSLKNLGEVCTSDFL